MTDPQCNGSPHQEYDPYSDTIERILEAVDARSAAAHGGSIEASPSSTQSQASFHSSGPLTPREIETLNVLCASVSNAPTYNNEMKSGFAAVESESLVSLIQLLEQHVRSGCIVDLIRELHVVMNKSGGEGNNGIDSYIQHTLPQRLLLIRQGMDAAVVMLNIMKAEGVDRRAVTEDGIEACVEMARHHLAKNVLPSISQTGHLLFTAPIETSSDPFEHGQSTPPARKKLKKSTSHLVQEKQQAVRVLKKLYKPVLASAGNLVVLMENIEGLVSAVPIDDRPLLTMCTSLLQSFTVDPPKANASLARLLQASAISLLSTVFQRYSGHRASILSDMVPLMPKLPTSKRSMLNYPVESAIDLSNGSGGGRNRSLTRSSSQKSIQAFSALLMSLIQSCVVMPAPQENGGQLTSGLRDCQAVCTAFATQFLKKCSQRGEDGGASEYRPVLSNLVDDLILLLLSAEYPAAESLLIALCQVLSNDLIKASAAANTSKVNSSPTESTYLTTAMDTMGKICSAIVARLALYREHPLKISGAARRQDNAEGEKKEVNGCFCGRPYKLDIEMLDCDNCHDWFHLLCVGLDPKNLPSKWTCDNCRLQQMVKDQTEAFAARSMRNNKTSNGGKGVDDDHQDEAHVFRQLLLNSLTRASQTTSSSLIERAREYHISKWVKELGGTNTNEKDQGFDSDLLCKHYLAQWEPAVASLLTLNQQDSSPSLTAEGNARMMLALLATKSDLAIAFPRMLGIVVSLLGSPLVSLRKLSLKAISQVVEVDSHIMLQPTMRNAVSKSLQDDAISVREAAVALVGSYIAKSPTLATAFHKPLMSLLSDQGVSVRKRTVRIFREMLISNPSFTGSSVVCASMLQRAADPKEDDGVRDLIHALFQQLWLKDTGKSFRLPQSEQGESPQRQERVIDTGGVLGNIVTPNETPIAKPTKQTPTNGSCTPAAVQMVEVVRCTGNGDFLSSLLKDILGDFSDGNKDRKVAERRKQQRGALKQCEQHIKSLIELLIQEDRKLQEGNRGGDKLVAIMRTLEVFAQTTPLLVRDHIDNLLPYLKADNGISFKDEAAVVSSTSNIVCRVAPSMKRPDLQRLSSSSIVDDLVKITKRFGAGALRSAVKCLAALAEHKNAVESDHVHKKMLALASEFYVYLYDKRDSTDDFTQTSVKVRSNIHRALAVLGALCRDLDCQDEDPNWIDNLPEEYMDFDGRPLSWSTFPMSCYCLFSKYFAKEDVETKCAALRAMCGIFASRPKVMLEVEQAGIVAEVISPTAHPHLQLDALHCFHEILVAEEERIDTGEAKAKMDSKRKVTVSKRISGDQDGDATLVGGVLTKHAPRLFELTCSDSENIRYATVELLGDLLRQGLINPMDCVPYLFALQGDVGSPSIRELALKLLVREGEKRPSMLRQRARAGVRQAYYFQQTVYPKNQVTAVVRRKKGKTLEVESIFCNVFKECISSSRKQREGLYRSLLGLFDDEGTQAKASSEPFTNKLPLLSFAVQVLAHLPYTAAGDPLFVIYQISSVVVAQGEQLIDKLAAVLGCDELDEHNFEEDGLEKAAKSKNPSRSNDASLLNESDFDIDAFAELCAKGYALVLLLRLKSFLREVYNLSETRCLAYVPSEKESVFSRGICLPDHMPVFDSSFEDSFKNKPKTEQHSASYNKDALIRQYAEFRRLLRSVSDQEEAASDESDAEKGGKRRSRKRRASEMTPEEAEGDSESS